MAQPESGESQLLERLLALDALLPTLAAALDVREVFAPLSEVARKLIPHDMLLLTLVDDDREHATLHALNGGEGVFDSPVLSLAHHKSLAESVSWESVIVPDMQEDPAERALPPGRAGYRARLMVPIRLRGEHVGALDFFSLAPGIYRPVDGLIARRIADHVALALSHERLAEQAQRVAFERDRASRLERRVHALSEEVRALGGHGRVVGESAAWKLVLKRATQVAATDTTVLLLGESGTGKEVVARFVHRASARSDGPFVALNCAALPDQLLESELFGHERGAFTGALAPKPGQLEQAAGGVLFLDEVSEMSLAAQAKFLRVLQEREFQRLGGTRMLKADVRVVAASNRDLPAAIARGEFREDLYYRLNVFEIALPPLRDRPADVLPLSEAFLEDIARSFGRPPAGISRDARQRLLEYAWPGNVRQLRNTLERAAILCEGGLITGEHLSLPPQAAGGSPTTVGQPGDLRSMERAAIEEALRQARNNKSMAARKLGLTRTQLYVRLRRHGLG
jgi:transcriptional regulator with GAF, ATPase, and Fis domain